MLRNEPLLFVKGPPVFIKVVVKDEESTSVFVGNEDGLEVVGEVDKKCKKTGIRRCRKTANHKSGKSVNFRRIHYLGTPFARQVYRPLQFVLGEETIKGNN